MVSSVAWTEFSNIKNVKLNVHWIFYYHDLLIFHGTSGYDEKEKKKVTLSEITPRYKIYFSSCFIERAIAILQLNISRNNWN